jgi:hypothetical protein
MQVNKSVKKNILEDYLDIENMYIFGQIKRWFNFTTVNREKFIDVQPFNWSAYGSKKCVKLNFELVGGKSVRLC